jgi:nitrogen fixation/metabolism regulation signal transduction histidine kinase
MIAYKAEKIKEYGATLSVGAELLDIDDTLARDIASCLAITLDNAADAANVAREAQNIQDEKSAPDSPGFLFAVRADLWQQKNLLFIRVNNPLVTRLSYRDGELQSTKREAGHGLGLSALRRITEQYSGEVKIDDHDGIFSLRVMLLR